MNTQIVKVVANIPQLANINGTYKTKRNKNKYNRYFITHLWSA